MRLVRQIITVGNSVGITLPREFLDAYGLGKGALMEVRATGMGLLLRPLRVAPAPGAGRWTVGRSRRDRQRDRRED